LRAQFASDVKARINEIKDRGYINPAKGTLDCAIIFIPSEQVFAFGNERQTGVIEEAIKNKIILCSPITLFAILTVLRQAATNFNTEKASREILAVLGLVKQQWDKYKETMDKMGGRLKDAQEEYVKLVTTRERMLDRQLTRVDDLRSHQGIAPAEIPPELPAGEKEENL
jgi:DNA recombination protein RmuC